MQIESWVRELKDRVLAAEGHRRLNGNFDKALLLLRGVTETRAQSCARATRFVLPVSCWVYRGSGAKKVLSGTGAPSCHYLCFWVCGVVDRIATEEAAETWGDGFTEAWCTYCNNFPRS